MEEPPLYSAISPGLLQAYRETHFVVSGPAPFTLQIGKLCSDLAQLHRTAGVECSAFITACNPFSQELSPTENEARHAELGAILQQRGLPFHEGRGQHPSGGWPAEPSYLVIGLCLSAARELGTAWGQNAIVWAGADAVPALVLLR